MQPIEVSKTASSLSAKAFSVIMTSTHIPSQDLDRPEALVFRTIPNCVERKVIEQNVEIKLSESIRNTQLTTYNASYIQSV